jgi:CRP-like cAMP-binding protein
MIAPDSPLFNALTKTPVLAGVNQPALELLAREGIVHTYVTDEVVVREGDAGHSLYILAEGEVEVIKYLESRQATQLALLPQGAFFGEMCVVDPRPRAATVIALAPSTAIEIPAATLHHLYRAMPDQYSIFLLNIARDMARRLRSLDEAFAARSS